MSLSARPGTGGQENTAAAPGRPARGPRVGLALVGVLLIAVNLRVAFVSVGPLLGDIRADLDLSNPAAGLLAGLPLIAFAVFSPVAPVLSARLGLDRAVWTSLLLLALGIVLRSAPVPGAIWAGTALLGIGIAFLNVLIPSLVKRDFPHRVSQVTGSYTAVQAAAAALGAAVVVPIAGTSDGGWRLALGIWAGFALIAMAVLLPRVRRRASRPAAGNDGQGTYRSPWRSAIGWQVTLFMGLQSVSFYVLTTWLSVIEESRGVSQVVAGAHVSVFLLVGMLSSLITGTLLHRFADQRVVAVTGAALSCVTYAGLALVPDWTLLWVVVGAFACGSLIVVALSLFSLRTASHPQAASLSGMAQAVGYAIGALGPVVFGALHDWSGDWTLPLAAVAVAMLFTCLTAALAGRDRVIG